MSFQSLPKELKHHIVDMCQAADIRRKERFHYSNKAKLRFEALGALSLVNRELRAMTVEYVADTLWVKRPKDYARYVLANSPVKDTISTLQCKGASAVQVVDYLLYVVPRFPNIKAIYGLSRDHLDVLLGDAKLSESETDDVNLGKVQEARRQLEELVRKVTELQAFHSIEYLETLITLGQDSIETLYLIPSITDLGEDVLSHDLRGSQFHTFISRIPKLSSLAIAGLASSTSDLLDPFHPDCLTETYSFVNSLTTLRLCLAGSLHTGFTNLLEFCRIFTHLSRLVINVDFQDDVEHFDIEPFSLPYLRRLSIRSDGIHTYLMILSTISAPNLQQVALETSRAACLAQTSPSTIAPVGKLLVEKYPKLQRVFLDTQDRVGISRAAVDTLGSFLSKVGVSLRCDWVPGAHEVSLKKVWTTNWDLMDEDNAARLDRDEEDSEDEDDFTEFEPSSTHDETLAAVTKGASELGDWIKHQAETCRVTGDVEGGKKLMSLLEGIGNWKLHLED